ncbi:MAG: tetratricopeptide repeat protein [Gemmatimonadetes bacterium]|jgi:O-antigen ligase/tetratricopeptide (TPR) repeat protein|nr:tetratricopeptide repeat protein [Gemmatimonadota bacterium]MBT6148974.1 tetratricopeptide repeat protein [Gemmatimonadota bacterium]MBT7862865.1 tetratricopeptide repeat protein [Gemmatimonadota bacterium]
MDPAARWQVNFDRAIEVGVVLTILSVSLLYSSALADNFHAKSVVASALILWLGVAWWLRQRSIVGWSAAPILIVFVLFLLQALISSVWAYNPTRAGEVWLSYLAWPVLFVVGVHLAVDRQRLRRVLRLIMGTSLLVAVVGLLQYNGIDLVGLPSRYRGLPVATLGNTNFVAHYLDLILPLAAALLLPRASGRRDRWLSGIALVAGGILLLLTQSRGGWLSVGAAGVVMAGLVMRPQRWLRRLALVVLCVGLLSPVAEVFLRSLPVNDGGRTAQDVVEDLAQDAWARGVSVFDEADFSRSMRLLIWKDAWRMALAQGWTGVGPGHWGAEFQAYRSPESHRAWRDLIGQRQNQPFHAHQDYLQEWAETGLPGLLALLTLLGATAHACWRGARGSSRQAGEDDPGDALQRAMGLAGLGVVVAVASHALFTFNLRDAVVTTHLWLIVGLSIGTCLPLRRRSLTDNWRHAVAGLMLLVALTGTWLAVRTLAADVHFSRAMEYVHKKQGNRATLELREAVAWRDHDYRSHHWLGKVSLEMGRPAEALSALERSLELRAYNVAATRLLADAALQLGRIETAIDAARQAIAIDPLTSRNYELLAIARRRAGDASAAAAAWRQALAFRPDDVDLLAALAQDLDGAGKKQDAVAVLRRALKIAPDNGILHGNLGALLLGLDQLSEAQIHLRRATQLDRDNAANWHVNLAMVLIRQKRWEPARLEIRHARDLFPQDERWRRLERILEDRQEIR